MGSAQSGYVGGGVANPTYREVCSGSTGHAEEIVQVTFDPATISFREILDAFFADTRPTTLTARVRTPGPNTVLLFDHSPEQKQVAEQRIAELNAEGIRRAAEAVPFQAFYRAEDYHQEYFRNPSQGYCVAVAARWRSLRKQFAAKLKG